MTDFMPVNLKRLKKQYPRHLSIANVDSKSNRKPEKCLRNHIKDIKSVVSHLFSLSFFYSHNKVPETQVAFQYSTKHPRNR
jgi:hypothetical protein